MHTQLTTTFNSEQHRQYGLLGKSSKYPVLRRKWSIRSKVAKYRGKGSDGAKGCRTAQLKIRSSSHSQGSKLLSEFNDRNEERSRNLRSRDHNITVPAANDDLDPRHDWVCWCPLRCAGDPPCRRGR